MYNACQRFRSLNGFEPDDNSVDTPVCNCHGSGLVADSGIDPKLKAVCLPEAGKIVRAALDQTSGVIRTLQSGLGPGARLLGQE